MLDLIRDLGHGRGKSLLVCTHLLADVERTCDHVIVLSKGRVLASSPVGALVGEDRRSVRVQASGDLSAYRQALQARDMLVDTQEDGSLAVRLTAEDADPLFEVALHCGVTIRSVQPQRSSLEQSFLEALAAQEAQA